VASFPVVPPHAHFEAGLAVFADDHSGHFQAEHLAGQHAELHHRLSTASPQDTSQGGR
jgi:hypothetical protein